MRKVGRGRALPDANDVLDPKLAELAVAAAAAAIGATTAAAAAAAAAAATCCAARCAATSSTAAAATATLELAPEHVLKLVVAADVALVELAMAMLLEDLALVQPAAHLLAAIPPQQPVEGVHAILVQDRAQLVELGALRLSEAPVDDSATTACPARPARPARAGAAPLASPERIVEVRQRLVERRLGGVRVLGELLVLQQQRDDQLDLPLEEDGESDRPVVVGELDGRRRKGGAEAAHALQKGRERPHENGRRILKGLLHGLVLRVLGEELRGARGAGRAPHGTCSVKTTPATPRDHVPA